ncbi:MAG: hypothetical protein ACI8RZ_004697 [Myxococcota bacterium]|jgi:hypothetical protein
MAISRQTSVQDLLTEHTGFAEFLEWQGVDSLPIDPDETLEELCETWNMEWEDFEGELSVWLEEEVEERPVLDWNEPAGGEE